MQRCKGLAAPHRTCVYASACRHPGQRRLCRCDRQRLANLLARSHCRHFVGRQRGRQRLADLL
eukprot:7839173-Lingulodinium_polyedra.AAC.1